MGWVRSVRRHKTHSFIDLYDGSGSVQVLCKFPASGLQTGSSVLLQGELVQGPQCKEIHATSIEVTGPSDGVIYT